MSKATVVIYGRRLHHLLYSATSGIEKSLHGNVWWWWIESSSQQNLGYQYIRHCGSLKMIVTHSCLVPGVSLISNHLVFGSIRTYMTQCKRVSTSEEFESLWVDDDSKSFGFTIISMVLAGVGNRVLVSCKQNSNFCATKFWIGRDFYLTYQFLMIECGSTHGRPLVPFVSNK